MSIGNDNGAQLTMPVMPAGMGGYGGMGGFGGDGGWWGILFLIAIMCGGWGGFGGFGGMGGLMGMWPLLFGGFGNGFGGGSASAQGALTREQACIDQNFNNLARTAEVTNSAVNQGFANLNSTICHQEYETAQLINGVGNTVQQGFMQAELSRCNQQAALMAQLNAMNVTAMQNANAAQAQLADCCCKEQIGQMQIGNQIERGFCQTNFNDQVNTTAIIQNAHGDTDRILARLDAMENARKDETIADLRTKLAACGDQTTAQYVINQITARLDPRPVPAYPAASPCGLGNWSPAVLANGYGYNGYNGCGCGCGCNG